MAHVSYLTLTGEKQGLISSGCNTKDSMGNRYQETHTDQITVLACDYSMSRLSGQHGVTHPGIQITKPKDKSSPLLASAFAKQEHLEGTIDFYRTNESGHNQKFYSIKFQKAVITGISEAMPHTVDSNGEDMHEMITFNYKGIHVEHFPCGTMAFDGWENANNLDANNTQPIQQPTHAPSPAAENESTVNTATASSSAENENAGNNATTSPAEENAHEENTTTTAAPVEENGNEEVCPYCKKKKHDFVEKGKEGTNGGKGQTLRENIIGPVENHRWYTGKHSLEAHHLICSEALDTNDWEKYCRIFGYNINHRKNGVMLPYEMDLACQLHVPLHRSNHGKGAAGGDPYPKKIQKLLKVVKEDIKSGKYCDNPKALVDSLDRFSKRILKKIDTFSWTITADGRDYADGETGCAGVSSITNKPNKPCPHDRMHGLSKHNNSTPLPRQSGPLQIGQ